MELKLLNFFFLVLLTVQIGQTWCRYVPSTIREIQSVRGLSLDPNDVDSQQYMLRDMDPEAIKTLLRTKQPVIQSLTDNEGRNVTITYQLFPSGEIRREKMTEMPRNDINFMALSSDWPSFQPGEDRYVMRESLGATTPRSSLKPYTFTLGNAQEVYPQMLSGTLRRISISSEPSSNRQNTFNWPTHPDTEYITRNEQPTNAFMTPIRRTWTMPMPMPMPDYKPSNSRPLFEEPNFITLHRTSPNSPEFTATAPAKPPTRQYNVIRQIDGITLQAECTSSKTRSSTQNGQSDPLYETENGFSLPHSLEWTPAIIGQSFTKTNTDTTERCTVTDVQLPQRLNKIPIETTTTTTAEPLPQSSIPLCLNPDPQTSNANAPIDINESDKDIDKFLKKINISEEEIKAEGGEYIKNIIEENGRILSIKLILSEVQGDQTTPANTEDQLPENDKPFK